MLRKCSTKNKKLSDAYIKRFLNKHFLYILYPQILKYSNKKFLMLCVHCNLIAELNKTHCADFYLLYYFVY